MPYQVMFWAPGGMATVIVATSLINYSLTKNFWFQDKKVDTIPDRQKIREKLFTIEGTEERQQEYVLQIQRNTVSFENNNNSILLPNTLFFLTSFVVLFIINFTAISILHINNPDVIRDLFSEVYQAIIVNPGTFNKWFNDLVQLGALHIFILNMIFFLILMSITGTILNYRNLRVPVIGSPAFFQLPFFTIWIYIISGMLFFFALKTHPNAIFLFAAKNLFYILSTLFIFQGISIIWLFLQVRILPAAGALISLVLFAFMFQLLTVIIFSIFLLIGLLDFWFDFRKKALHPNLFSDGV